MARPARAGDAGHRRRRAGGPRGQRRAGVRRPGSSAACGPGVVPVPLSTMLTRRRARRDRRRRRRPGGRRVGRVRRPHRSDRRRRAERARTPSSSASRRRTSPCRCTGGPSSRRRARLPVAPTTAGLAGVLAVQLRHDRRAEGRDAPPRQPAGDRRHVRRARCSASAPDDRFLSVAKLFFAYGLGNSLTFPFAVGATAILEPRRPTPPGIARARRGRAADAVLRQPRLRRRAARHRRARRRLRLGAGDGDGRRVAARRPAAPVQRALRPSRARRHRLDRGAAHLPVQHARRPAPGTSGRPVPGYEAQLLDDDGAEVTAPDTPGYLHVRGPSIATGYWQRPEATAAAFRRRLAAHRRRLHALGRRRTGRSSAATTT